MSKPKSGLFKYTLGFKNSESPSFDSSNARKPKKVNNKNQSKKKGRKQKLIDEVIKKYGKNKISPDKVLRIGRRKNGDIIWMEIGYEGTPTKKGSGYLHILEHKLDFKEAGYDIKKLKTIVFRTALKGKIIGFQANDSTRPIYEYTYKGRTYMISITISKEGYIVGANPRTKIKNKERINYEKNN